MFFNFEKDGDEEEKAMNTGEDPGLETAKMQTRTMSFEMLRFLLKRYETSFPITDAQNANPWGCGPIYYLGEHRCSIACRPYFLRVGHFYLCRSSGNVHYCPPEGCSEGKVPKGANGTHCPITGMFSYEFLVDEFERTAGKRKNQGADMDTDYEGMAAQMHDTEDCGGGDEDVYRRSSSSSSKRQKIDNGGLRLSKEGQQSNAKEIQKLQSKADSYVQSLLPLPLLNAIRLRWIVDENVLYLWKVLIQTKQYQEHSLRYRLTQHIQVVLDGMIDGLEVDHKKVIPRVQPLRQAVQELSGGLAIRPDLASKKFFRAALAEALGEDPQKKEKLLSAIEKRE